LTSLLFHDIGKICKLTGEDITHEELSSRFFLRFVNELTSKKAEIKLINNCILFHMQPRNIAIMTGEDILLILKVFGNDLNTFLDVTTADICCRYKNYDSKQVELNISNYQYGVVDRFNEINKYYNQLKIQFNGQYFINKKIYGYKIGEYQTKLYSDMISTYNKKLNLGDL
jgi:hypothetical protein